jgi:cvfA/B/C family virulence factor
MARYQILYWKQIPAQVKVFDEGRRPISRQLPERFQVEIDRIAILEGLSGTDEYLNQWRWTPKVERAGTAEEVAEALVQELQRELPVDQTS